MVGDSDTGMKSVVRDGIGGSITTIEVMSVRSIDTKKKVAEAILI